MYYNSTKIHSFIHSFTYDCMERRVVILPKACQLSVKFEAICREAVRFFAHGQLSVKPKSQGLSSGFVSCQ